MLRNDWIDCAFIGIAAGATGGVMGYLLKFGVDVVAVLGFFGALAGAVITVSGAIYFSKRDKLNAHAAEVEIIYQSVIPLVYDLREIAELWPKQVGVSGFTPEFRRTITLAGSNSFKAASILGEAIAYAQTLNFQQRANLRQCQEVIQGFVRYYESAMAPFSLDDDYDCNDDVNWFIKVHQVRGFIKLLFDSLNKKMPMSQAIDTAPSAAPSAI